MQITLKDLSYTYKGEKGDSLGVDHLSLDIKDGTMLGLLGPSGCGKTTLLNLISGLLPPIPVRFISERKTSPPFLQRKEGSVMSSRTTLYIRI